MGCCPSSPAVADAREPLLSPSAQHTGGMEAPGRSSYSSTGDRAEAASSAYAPPPAPVVTAPSSSSASARADTHLEPAKEKNEKSDERTKPTLAESGEVSTTTGGTSSLASSGVTATGLRVVDAPRPGEETLNMSKEEEFDFYRKRMEQLNREKEEINARFQQEELEKQKQLEKQQAKKPSFRNFFKGEDNEADDFAIGAPQGFKHEAHIGWSPDGGFDIRNVPNEWKQLLGKAGVTEEQMQDKETAMFIVSFVASTLNKSDQTQSPQVQPQRKMTEPAQPIHQEKVDQQIPVEETPAHPEAEPALPSAVVSAPPPPPAVQVNQPSPSLTSGTPPPPPAVTPKTSVADEGSGDMFAAIRGGVALKKVAALPDVKNLSVEEEDSIAGALARALQSRRFALKEEEVEEEASDDDEWKD